MNLDTIFYKGCIDKPAVIFIHGLGMDKDIWVNPSNSCILGGRFPIKTILGKRPSAKDFGLFRNMPSEKVPKFSTGEHSGNIQTLFDDLRYKGYTVFTWSQKRPAGPIESVEPELKEIVRNVKKMTKAGIILIGHSRGGLMGRKYLLKKDRSIKGLITISTPHKGSSIARIANYLSPLVPIINPFFTGSDKGTLSFAIKRILEFLKSKALKELLPESKFFKSLKDGPSDSVHYISVGGTNPTLFRFYRWRWNPVREGEIQRWFLMPDELFSIPDIFEKVIPENLYPEEMKKGKGDGLVSAESSKIPWCNVHYNFELNHAEVLFDKEVRNTLIKEIENRFF
jgi:pimeloyl-ACP methyl ester carboxylesterase